MKNLKKFKVVRIYYLSIGDKKEPYTFLFKQYFKGSLYGTMETGRLFIPVQ